MLVTDSWMTYLFFQQKKEFVKQKLAAKKQVAGKNEQEDKVETLSPEEMSEFYKKFLDDNYKHHVQYNK